MSQQQREPSEPAGELHPRDQLRRQQGERRQVRPQRVAQRLHRKQGWMHCKLEYKVTK